MQAPGVGSFERRILEVNRKRVKVVKPGSKTSFPTTEIRGSYAPPFHVSFCLPSRHSHVSLQPFHPWGFGRLRIDIPTHSILTIILRKCFGCANSWIYLCWIVLHLCMEKDRKGKFLSISAFFGYYKIPNFLIFVSYFLSF